MTMSEKSQQISFFEMESDRTSLQADSHVRTSQSQENRLELLAKDQAYGQNSPELLAKYNPNTQSWKTSQLSFLETAEDGLEEFLETWPRSGMTVNGTAYQLPRLAPTITEIGSGLLPTPRSCSAMSAKITEKTAQAKYPNLETVVARQIWPTPMSSDYKFAYKHTDRNAHQTGLATAVQKYWPTPTANNAKQGAYPSEYTRNTPTLSAQVGGSLNPNWVEWLMGFPIGHTDLKA